MINFNSKQAIFAAVVNSISNITLRTLSFALIIAVSDDAFSAELDTSAVSAFSEATEIFGKSFRPFVVGLGDLCERRQLYIALHSPGPFDGEVIARDARAFCAPLSSAALGGRLYGEVLISYSVALRHKYLTAYKDGEQGETDVRNISGLLYAIKSDESYSTPVFQNTSLYSLAKRAAELYLAPPQEKVTSAQLERDTELVTGVVTAMQRFVDFVYSHQAQDNKVIIQGEIARAILRSSAPTQAEVDGTQGARREQMELIYEEGLIDEDIRRATAFVAAATKLLAAHAVISKDLASNSRLAKGQMPLVEVTEFVRAAQDLDARK